MSRADDLLDWYAGVARPLPWRATRDPYALLVSEVMLQQTQAARVVPRYEAFLARFPDAPTLAAAPARDVLEEWSGLGYNRRALALRAAAGHVAAHGWPADLETLPGVGAYTAAAVASFAWDAQRAAVDVNVARVIGRWDGRDYTPRPLAERAAALLPAGRAATWNQAMMELGATVCTARVPRCGACPVAAGCASAGAPPAPPRRPRPAAAALRGDRPLRARPRRRRAARGGVAARASVRAARARAGRARRGRPRRPRRGGRSLAALSRPARAGASR